MIIGIGNNSKKDGKIQIRKYFLKKGYYVLDCNALIDEVELNLFNKNDLDEIIANAIHQNEKLVIDFTNIGEYKDYLDLCDFIIDVNYNHVDTTLGLHRGFDAVVQFSTEAKYYHKAINPNNAKWEEEINEALQFNFENSTKVSIVVPCYNGADYLAKCINSICAQSYKNLEIILVDDGSTDNTLSIMKKYSKLDDRIVVCHKKNGGLSSARNHGLAKATGEYVMYVDSDDYIEKTMVETLLRKILEEDADVCEGGVFVHNKDDSIVLIYDMLTLSEKVDDKRELLTRYADGNLLIAAWNKLYRTSATKKFKFDPNVFKEDSDYILRLCANGLSFVQIPMPLYHYVKKDSGSLTGNKFNERFFNLSTWCEGMVKKLLAKDRSYEEITKKLLFNTYVHILKYYLRDFNKGVLNNNEFHEEILDIYNKLVKLIINTENVDMYRNFNTIIQLLHVVLDKKIILPHEVYKQAQPCIGFIWNSLDKGQRNEIVEKIGKVGKIDSVINMDLGDKYRSFIEDIYVENHEAEGIPFMKYAILKDQFASNEITVVYTTIDVCLYEYTNKLKGFQFEILAELKRNIRNDYKNKIGDKYAFDNIFHLTMNDAEYELTDEIIKRYLEEVK